LHRDVTGRRRERALRIGVAWAALFMVLAGGLGACRLAQREGGPALSRSRAKAVPRRERSSSPQAVGSPRIGEQRYAGKRYIVCEVDLDRDRLELFWRDDAGRPFTTFDALAGSLRSKGRRLAFAMNAGMFREDYSPVGLYVEGGKQLRKLNRARGSGNFCWKPNGVFLLTRSGARVVETSRYPAHAVGAVCATQSGPMLVIDGKLHPGFGKSSQSRLIRNGVGVVSPRKVVFAIAQDPVNFHEFAAFFRDGLQCRNALYLDGSVSSLYSAALNRDDSWALLGPMVAVTVAADDRK
jgi:uncharacterized protein YigE (DUF2233 family)